MDVKDYTLSGVQTSLQIARLGNIPSGDFYLGKLFLVKNITEDNITITIVMPNKDEIETVLYPGWNPEILIGIKGVVEGQLQYGY